MGAEEGKAAKNLAQVFPPGGCRRWCDPWVSTELGLCQPLKVLEQHPGETLQRQAQAFPASVEIGEKKAGKLHSVLCRKPLKDGCAPALCLKALPADGLLLLQPDSALPPGFDLISQSFMK